MWAWRATTDRFGGVRALDKDPVRGAIVTRQSRCRSVLHTSVCEVTDAGRTEETARLDPSEAERAEERIRSP
jgi:hypothetical protein